MVRKQLCQGYRHLWEIELCRWYWSHIFHKSIVMINHFLISLSNIKWEYAPKPFVRNHLCIKFICKSIIMVYVDNDCISTFFHISYPFPLFSNHYIKFSISTHDFKICIDFSNAIICWSYHKYVCFSMLYNCCAVHCSSICHNIHTAFLQIFCWLKFLHASHMLPFKTKTVDSRKLHTKLWFVYRRTTSMGKILFAAWSLLQLNNKGSRMHTILQTDVLAWLPPFASLSVSAQPTSTSTKANPYMSFHIFSEVTLEVK